jgi:RNA 3'-terminal phosphate cyclase (ATP)
MVESQPLPAGPSRGAALALAAAYDRVTVTFGSLGAQPVPLPVAEATKAAAARPAEAVGREVAEAFAAHHASGMALDEYLADQIVLPLALASAGLQGGPTPIHRFTCTRVTAHLLATAAVVRRFLPVEVAVFGREGEPGDVRVAPLGIGEVVRLRG